MQREHLEVVEVELTEKRREMMEMADKRQQLEGNLRNALDKIEDLKDVINRLESDISSREESHNALTKVRSHSSCYILPRTYVCSSYKSVQLLFTATCGEPTCP